MKLQLTMTILLSTMTGLVSMMSLVMMLMMMAFVMMKTIVLEHMTNAKYVTETELQKASVTVTETP